MRLQFQPEAIREIDDAIVWYNREKPIPGHEFSVELADTVDRILQFPQAWPLLERGIRRCRTNRFPYGVVYRVENDLVRVLAVMHLKRRPGYWKARLRNL